MPLSPPPRHDLLRPLWDQRSIRAQLLLIVALIDVIALLLAGTVAVLRVRTQTRIEMAASLRLAEALVGDVVNLTRHELPVEQFLSELPAQLRSIRHVRITVKDAGGAPVAVTPSVESADAGRASAPAAFAALVAAAIEFHELPVVADGRRIGAVEIAGEPSDEIAEFWENAVAVGVLVVLLNVAMICILYVLFGRVLDPLSALATGLSELGRQNYKVRLPKPRAVELSAITDHFNALASALQTLRSENLRLSRRLITAQDDERRRTALELHDEVGPCLFGLRANLSSIASAVSALPERIAYVTFTPSSITCRRLTAACSSGCDRWRWVMFRSRNCSTSSCASVHDNIRRFHSPTTLLHFRATTAIQSTSRYIAAFKRVLATPFATRMHDASRSNSLLPTMLRASF
jgi:two-component system sensor histidine kinase UhpB